MFSRASKIRLLALCGALLLPATCFADQPDRDMQVHGFITQMAVSTTGNDFGEDSQDHQAWDHREAGIGLTWRANPDWVVAGQVLARQAGRTDEGSLRLDHLTLSYSTNPDSESRYGVTMGQVKHPYGLFNMTSDVAHTRLGILQPQSIYHYRVRDLSLSAPGATVFGGHFGQDGDLEWQINAFVPTEDDGRLSNLFFGQPVAGKFSGKPSVTAQILTERHFQNVACRGAISYYNVSLDFESHTPAVLDGTSGVSGLILSADMSWDRWSLISELVFGKVMGKDYGAGISNTGLNKNMDGGYIQLNHKPGSDWTLYSRLGVLFLDTSDRNGTQFEAIEGAPAFTRYAKDFTIGVRKDYDRFSFWAEAVKVKGTAWLPDAETAPSAQRKNWSMLLLQASYHW